MRILRRSILIVVFFSIITGFVYFFPYRKPVSTYAPTVGESEIEQGNFAENEKESQSCSSCVSGVEEVYRDRYANATITDTDTDAETDTRLIPQMEGQVGGQADAGTDADTLCEIEDYQGKGFDIESKDGKVYIHITGGKEDRYYLRANAWLFSHGCDYYDENVVWVGLE